MLIDINKMPKKGKFFHSDLTTLIGMMGTGKTKFGNLVSTKLNLKFYDTDALIEKKFNIPINKLFEIQGEAFFRKVEKKIIESIIKNAKVTKEKAIISIGGGAFDNSYTRKLLLKNTKVIWLNTSLDFLVKRIGNGLNRPMIQGDVKSSINMILKKRIKYYILSHYKINTDKLSQKKITDQIIKLIS